MAGAGAEKTNMQYATIRDLAFDRGKLVGWNCNG